VLLGLVVGESGWSPEAPGLTGLAGVWPRDADAANPRNAFRMKGS
jgi:hypothetical protein